MEEQKDTDKGLRYNAGKTRHELKPPFAEEQYAKVLTKGSEKYLPRNWELGMAWSKIIGCLERHLLAIKRGEDFDSETGLLHSAHLMCNAAFLTEYYKIYPQGDDRPHHYLTTPKIGLDIDEVLVDWLGAYKEKYGYKSEHEFNSWYLHYDIMERCTKDLGNDFYSKLKPKIKPTDLPFEPHCYITSRNIPTDVTKKWLYDNGFPCMPVYTVGLTDSKADIAKKAGIDVFVDDVYKNFVELNRAGICCYLLDAPHNRRYNVGHKRIYSLNDLVSKS